MKKFVAIIVTVTLCALCCVAFVACENEVNVEELYKKCDVHEEYPCGGLIVVNADVCSVYFRNNTVNDKVLVEYIQNDALTVSCKNTALTNTLNVECKWESNYAPANKNFVIISIPQSRISYNIAVEGDVGSVQMKDMQFTSVSVALTTGSILVENCDVSGQLLLGTTTGNLDVDDVEAVGAVVTSKTGSVHLDGDFAENVDVETTTGSIDVDLDAKRTTLEATTGSVHFDLDAEIIKVTTDTGSVSGTVKGAKSTYSIDVTTTTGSSNLTNQTVSGNKQLQIQTTTGSVKVSFEN